MLIADKKNILVVNKIKEELNKNNIALLDVIDNAVSPINSASDDMIECFNLDYNTFKQIKQFSDLTFVCNSRNAEYALKLIKKIVGLSNNIDYAPQIWRTKRSKKQQRWNDVLAKYL